MIFSKSPSNSPLSPYHSKIPLVSTFVIIVLNLTAKSISNSTFLYRNWINIHLTSILTLIWSNFHQISILKISSLIYKMNTILIIFFPILNMCLYYRIHVQYWISKKGRAPIGNATPIGFRILFSLFAFFSHSFLTLYNSYFVVEIALKVFFNTFNNLWKNLLIYCTIWGNKELNN